MTPLASVFRLCVVKRLGLKIFGFEGTRGPCVQAPAAARRPTNMRKGAAFAAPTIPRQRRHRRRASAPGKKRAPLSPSKRTPSASSSAEHIAANDGASPTASTRAKPSRRVKASNLAKSFGSASVARCVNARQRYSLRPAPISRAKACDFSNWRANASAFSTSRNASSFTGRPATSSPSRTKSRVFVTNTSR